MNLEIICDIKELKGKYIPSTRRHSVLSTSFADRIKSSSTLNVFVIQQNLANLVPLLLCNLLYFLISAVHSCSNDTYWQTEGCIRSQTVSIRHCLHLSTHLFVIMWFALWVQGTNSEKCKQCAVWKMDSTFRLLCMQPL